MKKPYRVFVPAVLAVTVGLLGWWGLSSPAAAQPPGGFPAPLRWEYKLMAYHPILENMEKELNKAGADGWEVAGNTTGAIPHIILKRHR